MKVRLSELRQIIQEELANVISEINVNALPAPSNDFQQQTGLRDGYDKLLRSFGSAVESQIIAQLFGDQLKSANGGQLNQAANQQLGEYRQQIEQQFSQGLSQFIEQQFVNAIKGFKPANGAGIEAKQQQPEPENTQDPTQRRTVMPPAMAG